MKEKTLQNLFSEKIDLLTKNAAADASVISDITVNPEIKTILDLSELDDLTSLIDTKLKRRLLEGREFKEAVGRIMLALEQGKFLINIVAKEYTHNKDMVDLILSAALMGHQTGFSAEGKPSELDKEIRLDKVNDSIIADVNVSELIKAANPKLAAQGGDVDGLAERIIDSSFFGSVGFNPKDRVNCCYGYVKDYMVDPEVNQLLVFDVLFQKAGILVGGLQE